MYYISANLAFGRREKKYFNFLNFKHYVFVGRQKNSGGGGGRQMVSLKRTSRTKKAL